MNSMNHWAENQTKASMLILLLFCLTGPSVSVLSAQEGIRPNILFLFSDDQRADTIAHYGNPVIQTPNMDRLAREGFNFRNTYCFGSPHGAVCQPSRAMLHSGRTLYRVPMDMKGTPTLGQVLGESGYQTFGTGKWHNGRGSFNRSFQMGRAIMFGGMSDHSKVPVCELKDDGSFTEPSSSTQFSSELFSNAAIEFLKSRNDDRPFFCYVSYSAPHDPRMPPGRYSKMYDQQMSLPENFLPQHPFDTGQMQVRDEKLAAWPREEGVIRQQLAEYYGMISHLDHQIGRILRALEDAGELENTMIVFTSDHGLAMGSHGLLGKQSLYEHSMKAPLIVQGPGIPKGSSNALVYIHDLYATICSAAQVSLPAETESISLMPVIHGCVAKIRSSLFTTYGKWIRAVRDQRWKLIRWPQLNKTQLFDLQNDPHEMNDLSGNASHQNQVSQLTALLKYWQQEVDDKQPLIVEEPASGEIDMTGRDRKPDKWQPDWIVEKYFSKQDRQ